MVYVYIIFSSSLNKYYVGYTEDVKMRLAQHNAGKGNFTSKGIPWVFVNKIECNSRSEVVRLELKIKKRGIKRYLQDNHLVWVVRVVAQPGSALAWGASGRWFESSPPDIIQ